MNDRGLRQFDVFFDRYYWQTAVLIARNGLARQYRNSFLGILWTLFQPLTMVAVYTVVMPMIMKFPVGHYTLFVVVSLPLWAFIANSMTGASRSILENGEMLKRCIISSTVFPIADVLRNTYTFMVSFATMYGVALILGIAKLNTLLLLLPLYFIPVLMIIGVCAITIAFVAPYLRDIGELVTLLMTVLYWLTPVIYPPSVLPPWAMFWMQWNPFFIMMHPIQMLAYEHVLPGMNEIVRLLSLTVIAILLGFAIFRVCRRNYVYYL